MDKKEETKENKEKTNPELLVVNELPTQPIRTIIEDGKEYELITINEALTELLISIRKIKKSVA